MLLLVGPPENNVANNEDCNNESHGGGVQLHGMVQKPPRLNSLGGGKVESSYFTELNRNLRVKLPG